MGCEHERPFDPQQDDQMEAYLDSIRSHLLQSEPVHTRERRGNRYPPFLVSPYVLIINIRKVVIKYPFPTLSYIHHAAGATSAGDCCSQGCHASSGTRFFTSKGQKFPRAETTGRERKNIQKAPQRLRLFFLDGCGLVDDVTVIPTLNVEFPDSFPFPFFDRFDLVVAEAFAARPWNVLVSYSSTCRRNVLFCRVLAAFLLRIFWVGLTVRERREVSRCTASPVLRLCLSSVALVAGDF